jgi:hypothetical protein
MLEVLGWSAEPYPRLNFAVSVEKDGGIPLMQ